MSRTVVTLFFVAAAAAVCADASDDESRHARAIWLPSKSNPSCTGGVVSILQGQTKTLTSHRAYGHQAYPSDYQCRWLVLPDACDLSLVCDLGVHSPNRGRDGDCSPLDDYLQLEGYGGAYDTKYCGHDRLSVRLTGALKMNFVSQAESRSKRKVYSTRY